ncbi:hypothetical protein EP7_004189 [Isosphaeraceae bacterium EP7]
MVGKIRTLGLGLLTLAWASSEVGAQVNPQANVPAAASPGGYVQSPYANPYMNPLFNPFSANASMDKTAVGYYAFQMQQANGGLGSGQLSGVRPSRNAGAADANRGVTGLADRGGDELPDRGVPTGLSRTFGGGKMSKAARQGRSVVGARPPSVVATGKVAGAGASRYFQRGIRQTDQTHSQFTRKGGFFQNYGY